jgi:uncharacterized membrane protein YfcA
MTPILLWFGIPPTTAVGTDLLYAASLKWYVFVHQEKLIVYHGLAFLR